MKSKAMTIVGITVVLAGAVISATLSKYAVGDITGLAVTMFGAGLMVANMWKNRAEGVKTVPTILGITLTSVGAFLLGITGVISENEMTTVIGYAISIALLLAGIITQFIASKDK